MGILIWSILLHVQGHMETRGDQFLRGDIHTINISVYLSILCQGHREESLPAQWLEGREVIRTQS